MRWGRDVIAPLLVACGPTLSCSSGREHLLSFVGSSTSRVWNLRRKAGIRRRRNSFLPHAVETAAVRPPRCRLGFNVAFVHEARCVPTACGDAIVMGIGDGEKGVATRTTRYTIDVSVHPDVESIAVKHASQLPRFLENYPISSHTKHAYADAINFVRDFHLSHGSLTWKRTRNGGGTTFHQRYGQEDRDKKEGIAVPPVPQQSQQPLPVVLDSGCGTGRSSVLLARMYPHLPVIGIDRSAVRLSKGGGATGSRIVGRGLHRDNSGNGANKQTIDEKELKADGEVDGGTSSASPNRGQLGQVGLQEPPPGNLLLLRADLVDLWVLASRDNAWKVEEHFILYPNPYPKRSQLRTRWHGHSVFPVLLSLGGNITLRSNWRAYLEEFCLAVLAIDGEAEKRRRLGDKPAVVGEGVLDNGEGGREWENSRDDRAGMSTPLAADRLMMAANKEMGDDRTRLPGTAEHPEIEIPATVAAAAASYAGSAREGPSLFVPAVPASTNFEAKYVAVGETVYELRLEPRRQQTLGAAPNAALRGQTIR